MQLFNINITTVQTLTTHQDIVGKKSVPLYTVCHKIFLTDDKLSLCFLNFQQLLKDKKGDKNKYLCCLST